MGVSPMNHGQDARATPASKGFARPSLNQLQKENTTMHASLTKKSHRTLLAIAAVCLAATLPVRAVTLTIGFDDTGLEPGTYVNGSDGYGAYHCGQVRFDNNYNFQYHSWDGFALSRVNNPTVGGWQNQYAVWGDGLDRSDGGGYAVVFYGSWSGPASLPLPYDSTVRGLFVNNTAYAADSMLNGDSFAKKFGGKSGKDPDWLKLIITGYDAAGNPVGTNEFYLATTALPTTRMTTSSPTGPGWSSPVSATASAR